jgi:outer membrane murein-binding lipoprotein Lpp
MFKQKSWFWMAGRMTLVLLGALVLTGCFSNARVGELRTESETVELGDAESVSVEINLGAGDLQVAGGATELLEADFSYNVAELKPEVEYSDGRLVIRQPDIGGLPVLRDITGYRNEWMLLLNDQVPIDLKVDVGAGTSNLQLADLSLTGFDISLGAGNSTIDLSGRWENDLDITINAGAGELHVKLPGDVGTRVEVETGIGSVNAPDLTKNGNIYTNAAYDQSDVALRVSIEAGVGQINLEVAEATPVPGYASPTGELSQLIQTIVAETGITENGGHEHLFYSGYLMKRIEPSN